MSQPISTNSSGLETADDRPPSAAASRTSGVGLMLAADGFSAEAYANRLMDDLFEDVERSLNDGTPLPVAASAAPPPSPLNPLLPMHRTPSIVPPEPSAQWEAVSPAPRPAAPPQSERDLAVVAAIADDLTPRDPDALARPEPTPKSFDALLLVLVFGSLATAAAVWYGLQLYGQRLAVPQAAVTADAIAQTTPADEAFLDYVQRSLGVIDRRTEITRQTGAIANGNVGGLPSVTVPGNPGNPPGSPTALERVYVPVYQPPAGMNLPGGSAASGAIAARPAPPSLSLPNLPLPTLPAAPGTVADPAARIPNIATISTYSLVGTLELGDPSRSAALFVINGTTQRVQVGEAIGSSGWALVSVKGDEAIVRRNGEVRSITTGQRF